MAELNIQYSRLQLLPLAARAFVYVHEGWIVGSGAKYLLGLQNKIPTDIDILVPFYEWGKACLVIPKGTTANSFGGFKLEQQRVDYDHDTHWLNIDIWPGDIGWFLADSKMFDGIAVQIKTHAILTREFGLIK